MKRIFTYFTIVCLSILITYMPSLVERNKKNDSTLYKVSVNNGRFILCNIERDQGKVNAINCSNGMNYYNQPLGISSFK